MNGARCTIIDVIRDKLSWWSDETIGCLETYEEQQSQPSNVMHFLQMAFIPLAQ
jgi:hypothetical protein